MSLLSRLPRDRTLPLLALIGGLVVLGALWRGLGREGQAPAPCAHPVMVAGELRCEGEGDPPGARAWLAGKPLDLNRASRKELEQLPGVGAGLAATIVRAREERGGFASVDELDEVRGIGPKTLARLRPYLSVSR